MAQGGQAATMAAPAATAYRAQYGMPVMPHSQLVPHMQQVGYWPVWNSMVIVTLAIILLNVIADAT